MATRLLLLLLVSACSAEFGFQPKRQCTYDYEAKQASGIPGLKTQWSALGMKMSVLVQAPTSDHLYIQLQDIKHGELLNKVANQLWRQHMDIPYHTITQFQDALGKVFKVEMKQGVVRSITTSQDDPTWVVNIKKSVAQLLQVNLKQHQWMDSRSPLQPHSYQNGKTTETDRFFRVMEDSIGGECETLYELTPQLTDSVKADILTELRQHSQSPGNLPQYSTFKPFVVTKTKNYQNCLSRPVWQHLTPPAVACRADDCHLTATNRSTSVRYVLDGDQTDFRIQSVVAESEALMFPYGHETEQLWTVTNQTMFLHDCKPMAGFIGEPSQPKTERSLAFQYPTGDGKPLSIPDLQSEPQISAVMPGVPVQLIKKNIGPAELVQHAQQLIQKVENFQEQVPDPVTQDVAGFVIEIERIFSWMSYHQLEQVYEGLHTQEQKEIFFDVLTMACTNPAVTLLIDYVMQREVTSARAATLIAPLPMCIKTPTPQIIYKLFQLFKRPTTQQWPAVHTTLALALGNIYHQVCVSNVTVDFSYATGLYPRPFCTDDMTTVLTQEVIPFLKQQIDNHQEPEKLVYIQALGNIGHKQIVPILKEIIATEPSALTKSKAVYALYRVNAQWPETAREIVSPLFHDQTQSAHVRLAAFTMLLAGNPPIAYWQKMAVGTWAERSHVVAGFVHSAYNWLANVTMAHVHPLFEMSRRARITLPLIRPPPSGYLHWNSYSTVADIVYHFQTADITKTSFIPSSKSVVPQAFYREFWQYINSVVYSSTKVVANVQGVESLIEEALASPGRRQSPRDLSVASDTLRTIERELKLQALPKREPFQSTAYVQVMGAIDAMFTVKSSQLDDMLERARQGGDFNAQHAQKLAYLEDKTVTFPSEIGLPVIYTKKTPIVVSVRGQMSAKWSYQEGTYTAAIEHAQPFVAFKSRVQVFTVSPFTLRVLGTGVENNVQLSLPMTIKATLDVDAKKLQVSTALVNQPSPVKVAHIKTFPFTTAVKVNDYSQLTTSPDTKEIIITGRKVIEIPFGEWVGIKGKLRLEYENQVMNFGTWYTEFQKRGSLKSQLSSWYLMDSLRSRQYDLIINTAQSESRKFETTWTWTSSWQRDTPIRHPIIESAHHHQKVLQSVRSVHDIMQQKSADNNSHLGLTATTTITQNGGRELHYAWLLALTADTEWYKQDLQFQGETPNNKVCLRTSLAYPALTDSRQGLLSGDVSIPLTANFGYGTDCQQHRITMKGRVERDQVAQSYATSCPEAQRCRVHEQQDNPNSADCRIAKDHAALANYAELEFTMHDLPIAFRNASYNLDYYAKYLFWPYTTNDPYKTNTKDKVLIQVRVNPATSTFSAHVMKPFETTKFEQVVMPFNVLYEPYLLTMRKSISKKITDSWFGVDKSVCLVDKQVVKTYDNLTMTWKPSSECWTLLTKDASDVMKLAILEKHINGQPAVRVLVDNHDIEIISLPSSFEVKVDRRTWPLDSREPITVHSSDHQTTLATISQPANDWVKVTLPKHWAQVKLTKEGVQIFISQIIYRNKLTGVCGNMDGETSDEMVGPQGCVFQNERPFFKSFWVPLDSQSQQCRPQLPDPSQCVRKPRTANAQSSSNYQPY